MDEVVARGGRPHQVFGPRYFRTLAGDTATIIDVGVYKGTTYLYEAFSSLPFILIDPIKDGEAAMLDKPLSYTFVNKAVGAAPGKLVLYHQGAKTGFRERSALTRRGGPREEYEVEITTLDSILDELNPPGPLGLKIDTEGYEIDVIRGLQRWADRISFVICEASIRRRFVQTPLFSELIKELAARNFEFYTILNEVKRKPRLYDMLFLPRSHPFFD